MMLKIMELSRLRSVVASPVVLYRLARLDARDGFPPRCGSEQHDQFCKSAALSRMFKKRRRPHNPVGRACFRILVSGSHAPSELSGVYFGLVYNVL